VSDCCPKVGEHEIIELCSSPSRRDSTTHETPRSDEFQQRQALIAAARAGDADAQCHMGEVCRAGDQFTEQDLAESLKWYALAAAQGHAGAQNDLGTMYCNGVGVADDLEEATKWYRRAADQGLAVAQFNLAMRYKCGKGVQADDHEAAVWFRKSADQGYVEAIGELGTLLRQGRGVTNSLPLAAQRHIAAALAGDLLSRNELTKYGAELEQEAHQGSMLAALCLAKMHEAGLTVEKSEATMFAWLMGGGYKGTHDDDPDVREELVDMRGHYAATLPDSVQDEAWRLFGQMWSPNAQVLDNRPRDAEGNVIHDEADPLLGNSRGGD